MRRLKRRSIHLNEAQCFAHSQSEEGVLALKSPTMRKSNADPNYKLHPVVLKKRRKVDSTNVDVVQPSEPDFHSTTRSVTTDSQGFVSAANMFNITRKPECHKLPSPKPKRKTPIKTIANQSSILSFMKSSSTPTHTKTSATDSEEGDSSQEIKMESSQRSVMYSPIKQLGGSGVIYISDSSPEKDTSSSQKSMTCSPPENIRDNAVVKQLFEAQKNIDYKGKKLKSTKSKKVASASKRLSTTKIEISNFFENDSFDMNSVFGSDMDDTFENNSIPKDEKEIKHSTSDKYGLLGSGSYPKGQKESAVNHFEHLPPEVLENIFCQLPMLDLCLNSNRVCLLWNDMISNPKFVPWKKLYHKLKKDVGTARHDVQELMLQNGMTTPTNYLTALIRYMKNFKPVTADNMVECLEKHSKYHWARDLIQERLPDCLTHKKPNPWCMMTTLVIVSHDVYDIQEILHCLSVSVSQCTATEVIECLYCVATFLYAFKLAKRNDVWAGMHYRLFYALYLYENRSSASCGDLQSITSSSRGQQSLVKYSDAGVSVQLTHEQLRIVKHQARPDEIIKIVAFAGTGKTTTLVKYTQLRPDKKFLLVVYNKSVCEYAKTKFPPNVTCKTGHALAFGEIGRRYMAAKKLWGIKVYTLTQALKLRKGDNQFIRAKFVMDTIDTYLSSADPFITTAHVPDSRINDKTGFKEDIDHPTKMRYVEDAEYIWRRMMDYKDKKVGMSHDGYLKLYQLSRPKLSYYDSILVDEAQDLTPAITDVLTSQSQGKILVGDPHQQIYSFRGAINAMDRIQAHTVFYLTQSFRFGPEIAQVAASCLEVLKKVKEKTLVGSGNKGCVLGEQIGQLAIISRCNFTVFNEAVKKCCYSNNDCKVAFVGGTDNFGFPMLRDIYALMLSPQERKKQGLEITNGLIKGFSSFGTLDSFATKTMDSELLGKIKIVRTHHHNLPIILRKIESKCVSDIRRADIVFSTAHKAKGLEFSTVRVTDDFSVDQHPAAVMVGDIAMLAFPVPLSIREPNSDEKNLLYVAVSRAKNALQMTPTITRVLSQAGERFDFPVHSQQLKDKGTVFKCMETDAQFEPKALTLVKKELKLGDGMVIGGGLISPRLLTEDMGSFSQLLGLLPHEHELEKKKMAAIEADNFY